MLRESIQLQIPYHSIPNAFGCSLKMRLYCNSKNLILNGKLDALVLACFSGWILSEFMSDSTKTVNSVCALKCGKQCFPRETIKIFRKKSKERYYLATTKNCEFRNKFP